MIGRLRGWARALFQRARLDREMDEELAIHLERAAERLIARGLTPDAARAEARREFGHVASLREDAQDARGLRWIDDAIRDVRYAVRGLRARPGFSLAVVAILGLGVGANATVFGIADRMFFRPPPYLIGAERSHHVYLARVIGGREQLGQAAQYRRFLDLAERSSTTEVVAAYAPRRLYVGAGDDARDVAFGFASASFWRLFDAKPTVGRFFGEAEDRDRGDRVAVLSYSYWQTAYGKSRDAVGSSILIWPNRYEVIGVAPRGFGGVELETPDVFLPMAVAAADDFGATWATDRAEYAVTWLEIYARRKSGVPLAAAEADLSDAYRASYRAQIAMDPRTPPIDVAKPRIVLGSMLAQRGPSPSAEARVAAWLLGVTAIVLLVACANVANLLLARAVSRRREIAVRVALGATRMRLVRYLSAEAIVLAVAGTIAGLLIAQTGGHLVRTFLLPTVEWDAPVADSRILIFGALVALGTALVAGLTPVIHGSRADVNAVLKAGGRGSSGGARARGVLILVQAALSVVLLVGGGLFLRSVDRVGQVHLGYDADQLLIAQLRLRDAALDSAQQVALRHALLSRAVANPIVEAASLVYSVPFAGTRTGSAFVDGVDSTHRFGEILEQSASPDYFATTGTRIVRGRGVSVDDRAGAPLVAIVSESMAATLWPGQDAIGKCIRRRSATAPCRTIVGVAENVKQASLGDAKGLMYYLPSAQAGEHQGRLLVRVRGDVVVQAEAVRRDLQRAMPASAYIVVRPMSRTLSSVTRSWRLGATMFLVFGALALAMAAVGLYSVVSFAVAQRTHEVGVRIALGARQADVAALVVHDALRVVAIGTLAGAGFALAAGPWLEPLLFQVSPRDPAVFTVVALLLMVVGVAAGSVPAFRATRVDPSMALRAD